MLPSGPNPFHPGYGVIPPILAGRDELQREIREQLDNFGHPPLDPTPRALLGPRGCGKTTLLKWVDTEAQKRKLPVVALASDDFATLADMSGGMESQFPPNLLERIRGIKVNVGAVGAGIDLANQTAKELKTWLAGLGGVLLVDEAHNMPPEVGHVFYNTIQKINHPLMVVIAGTPDLEQVLGRSKATFIERVPAESIGLLERDDSRQALFEPFGKHVRFSDEVVEHVLEDAQDYPYFIQLWGKSLWDVLKTSPNRHPDMEVVTSAQVAVNKRRSQLYSRRMEELNNANIWVLVAEMAWRLGEAGQPSADDLELAIQHLEPGLPLGKDRSDVKKKLLHTGFIWQPDIGIWEYGIPSLASHVRKEAVHQLLRALKGRPENIIALGALDQCFGEPAKRRRDLLRDELSEKIKTFMRVSGVSDEDMIRDPVAGFMAGMLLVEGDTPDRVCLAAPHLVRATVEEAIRRELLPYPDPLAETGPDSNRKISKSPRPSVH